MDFTLTQLQIDLFKSLAGLSLAFIVLPGIAAFTLYKIIGLIPEKYLEKVL